MDSVSDDLLKGFVAETKALSSLQYYADNYINLVFMGLGSHNEKITLGSKPFKCRFCGGQKPERTFKKRAHAVSELLGNKTIKSFYECDSCNERFSKFESELGNMTLPMRNVGGVMGKNGVPKLEIITNRGDQKPTMIFKDRTFFARGR